MNVRAKDLRSLFFLKRNCTYQTCWDFLEDYTPLIQDMFSFFQSVALSSRNRPLNDRPLVLSVDALCLRVIYYLCPLAGRLFIDYICTLQFINGQSVDALSDSRSNYLYIFICVQSADAWGLLQFKCIRELFFFNFISFFLKLNFSVSLVIFLICSRLDTFFI